MRTEEEIRVRYEKRDECILKGRYAGKRTCLRGARDDARLENKCAFSLKKSYVRARTRVKEVTTIHDRSLIFCL